MCISTSFLLNKIQILRHDVQYYEYKYNNKQFLYSLSRTKTKLINETLN